MNIWRASLRHERPERPGVQSPRADVRSARACVRQSSFCEVQDFLQSRHALSHLFLAASMCETLTSRRTRASSVRRGQIRGMAPQPRGPCLRASIMVGRPSGYGGFPYQRNTFCSRWRSSPMPPSRTSGLGPLAPPAPRCRGAKRRHRRAFGRSGRSLSFDVRQPLARLLRNLKLGARAEITITQATRGGAPESTFTNLGERSVSSDFRILLPPFAERVFGAIRHSAYACMFATDFAENTPGSRPGPAGSPLGSDR